MREIRPYVTFNHDLRKPLSSAAKRQISAYYEQIQKLTVRPHQIYRTTNKENLRAVQRFAQHDPRRFGKIKVAFVPNAGGEPLRIRIGKDGRVHGTTTHVGIIDIPLDPERLALEGKDYIDAQIDRAPRAKMYSVQAGNFEVPSARARQFITEYVLDLMNRYSADRFDEDNQSSHYYGNWMFGINGYNFTNQQDMMTYRANKRALTKKRAREGVVKRRKEKRLLENPPGFWLNDDKSLAKRARPPQPKGWRKVSQREFYKAIFAHGYKEIKDRTA